MPHHKLFNWPIMTTPKNSSFSIRGLILDMDGVLWHDDHPIGNLPEVFTMIRSRSLRVVLATNNSTKTVAQYLDKLLGFGVVLEPKQVVTSSMATAAYLRKCFPSGGAVFSIGEIGLRQTLQEQGFYFAQKDVRAVVVGLDREFTYEKLKTAALLVRSGVPLIATNSDRTLPTPEGFIPGAGAVLAAIEAATDQRAVVIGKPSPELYRLALNSLDTLPEETLVVGDRIETDIVGAQNLGCRTALVLSGVSTIAQAKQWQPAPDLIADNLTTVLQTL